MKYIGEIIEESLDNKSIITRLKIVKTRIEKVTNRHKTPWTGQWTIHTVEIEENDIGKIVNLLSGVIETNHSSSWYVDFKNDKYHYIVFRSKIFKVDLKNPYLYKEAERYGEKLGIPVYQIQFEHLKRNGGQ